VDIPGIGVFIRGVFFQRTRKLQRFYSAPASLFIALSAVKYLELGVFILQSFTWNKNANSR
jgi:hypothetical protein